jgi:hypothetical protein
VEAGYELWCVAWVAANNPDTQQRVGFHSRKPCRCIRSRPQCKHGGVSTVFSLDRRQLETEGQATSNGRTFFTNPYEVRHADEIVEAERKHEEEERKRQELLDSVSPDELLKIEQALGEMTKLDLASKIELYRNLFGTMPPNQ